MVKVGVYGQIFVGLGYTLLRSTALKVGEDRVCEVSLEGIAIWVKAGPAAKGIAVVLIVSVNVMHELDDLKELTNPTC